MAVLRSTAKRLRTASLWLTREAAATDIRRMIVQGRRIAIDPRRYRYR